MTRAELVELLAVERFAPPPRPTPTRPRVAPGEPREVSVDPHAAEHLQALADALDGTDDAVIPLRRKGAA